MSGAGASRHGRRLAAGGALLTTVLAAAGTIRAATASTLLCPTPQISGMSQHLNNGRAVTVTGSGFTSPAGSCTLSLSIGGSGAPVQVQSDSSLTFTPPGAVNGAVVLTMTEPTVTNASNSSTATEYFYTAPSAAAPGAPVEGQPIDVTGGDFSFGGTSASAPSVSGCAAGGSYGAPTTIHTRAPGYYCGGPIQLTFHLPADATTYQSVTTVTNPITIQPAITGLGPASALPGSAVTVSGTGFGPSGAASIGGVPAPVSWSDHAVAVTVPATAVSGPVTLVRSVDGQSIAAGSITVGSLITGLTPPAAGVGDSVTISGAGFGPTPGSVRLGPLPLPVQRWSPASVVVSIPAGAVSGPLSMQTTGTLPPAPVALSIVAKLMGVSPAHAPAGAVLVISGTTLGAQAGSVSIAGRSADVALWADGQITATVPAGTRVGRTTLTVTPAGGPAASIGFTVDPGAASPAAAAAALAAAGVVPPPIPPSPNGPIVTHGGSVDFHPPRKPPSPINLTLTPSSDRADPGSTVQLTASLVAYGKPVPGAVIELVMVVEPGTDTVLAPARAITDHTGRTHGSVTLSQTAGDHIILARSGMYSDEIRVRGGSEEASALTSAGATVRRSLVWGILGCLLLLAAGFALNIATSPGAAVAGAGVWRARTPGPRGVVIAGARVVAAVVRAAASGWRNAGRRLLDRVNRIRPRRPGASPYPPM